MRLSTVVPLGRPFHSTSEFMAHDDRKYRERVRLDPAMPFRKTQHWVVAEVLHRGLVCTLEGDIPSLEAWKRLKNIT